MRNENENENEYRMRMGMRLDNMKMKNITSILCLYLLCSVGCYGQQWISFEGKGGPGEGKHIVLISGDEEYRSEEALPMLAKILSTHHGFKATVLFAIDPETGFINPDNQTNIPGLEQLRSADLMILFTRFRELPDDQMKYIDEYLRSGKPIIGMRTATHAFLYQENKDSPFAHYSYNHTGADWKDGFGRQVLGETWIDHHGDHGTEGTRGLINGILQRTDHPVLRGVRDIWVPTDVYGTRTLTDNPDILVWGQPTKGMTPEAQVNLEKSIMPIAWVKEYRGEKLMVNKVFTTTMGASIDLLNEDLRRLLVNACYWGLEMEVPDRNVVEFVGEYSPTMFGFGKYKTGMKPVDYIH